MEALDLTLKEFERLDYPNREKEFKFLKQSVLSKNAQISELMRLVDTLEESNQESDVKPILIKDGYMIYRER